MRLGIRVYSGFWASQDTLRPNERPNGAVFLGFELWLVCKIDLVKDRFSDLYTIGFVSVSKIGAGHANLLNPYGDLGTWKKKRVTKNSC